MALAVPFSPPAMDGEQPGPGVGPGVHPFFRAQRGRSREPADEEGLDYEGMTDSAGDFPNGPKKAKRTRKRSQEQRIQQSTLNFGQRPAAPKENPAVEDASKEVGDAAGAEVPEARRKRQRTQSLERPATPKRETEMHPLGWEEQLIQAGFAGSSPSQPDQRATTATPIERQPAEILHSNAAEHSTAESTLDTAKGKWEPTTKTPPKKIIKLRMDGKLASPKAKDDGAKKTGGKRKSGEAAKLEQRLVVLKYGSDEPNRTQLGRQIEDILSRPLGAPRPRSQKPKQHTTEPSQAKQTHPFFTGKVARVKPDHVEPSVPEDSDVAASGAERPKSPTKLTGPLKSSWAGFGASFTKPQRPIGAIAAIWPPKDMVHIRGSTAFPARTIDTPTVATLKKLKGSATRVEAHEDVLSAYQGLVKSLTYSSDSTTLLARRFHRPNRKLLTGEQLVTLVKDQLACPEPKDGHPAVAKLYKEARVSLSAFDRFECENQEWAHKYAPKCIADVLCQDDTMLLLRDWIVGLTVNTVNSGSGASGAQQVVIAKKMKARAKKKRKISDGLDDFIVSSEDELSDEVNDPEDEGAVKQTLPRLSQRNIHRTRAVILKGPYGSGKTASVYAAAQELGFEVFEINSGTRRSGRDIMDRVGDMTRNHLVRQLPDDQDQEPKERASPAPDAQAEVESGRQSTVNSFFKAFSKPKPKKKQTKLTKEPPKKKPETPKKPSRKQKQSLILFEEVDVLFEEDKHFWSTVLTLLLSSRRPVIMTCTDESTLPFADMIDVATLRVSPPPEELVVDYLLLLAANEGHLISRNAITRIFLLSGNDLRASIAQLDFLCQMALGDSKGGLEWMLIRSNMQESQNDRGEALRVISESTFTRSMTTLMPDRDSEVVSPRENIDEELYLLQDVYRNWQLEPEVWIDADVLPDASISIQALRRFESAADSLSCADILPGMSFLDPDCSRLDATHPLLTDRQRSNYADGIPLLDSSLATDPTSLSTEVVLTLQLLSRRLRRPASSLSPNIISTLLSNRHASLTTQQKHHAAFLSHTLQALVLPSPTYLGHTSPSRLPATLSRILAADIAPYVRSIVVADTKLEAARLHLSGLLSEGAAVSKKARTTRASRAALEGGRKESTRRERWFRSELNYRNVRKTGRDTWEAAGEAALRETEAEMEKFREQTEEEEEDEVKREQQPATIGEEAALEANGGAKGEEDAAADAEGEPDDVPPGELGAKAYVNMQLD